MILPISFSDTKSFSIIPPAASALNWEFTPREPQILLSLSERASRLRLSDEAGYHELRRQLAVLAKNIFEYDALHRRLFEGGSRLSRLSVRSLHATSAGGER